MNQSKSPRMFAILVGLLNLSGLGLGYLILRSWVRWGIHVLATIALLLGAFLADAAKLPMVWIPALSLWLMWMAFDGWRKAREISGNAAEVPALLSAQNQWLLLAAAILLLVFEAAGFVAYSRLGEAEFQKGITAYREADCASALMRFERVTSLFELTFSPIVERADQRILECNVLLAADSAYQEGRYERAIQQYEEYLAMNPEQGLVDYTEDAIAQSNFGWGTDLLAEEDYEGAIEKFSVIVEDYPQASTARDVDDPLSEAYLDWATELLAGEDYQAAISRYSIVLEEYPATAAAQAVDEPLSEAYLLWSAQSWESQHYPKAVQSARVLLDDYPDTPTGREAPNQIAQIYFDWASDLQESGNFEEAVEKSLTVSDEFPRTDAAEGAPGLTASIYYEWANDLMERGEYQDSVEMFELIQAQYAENLTGKNLKEDIKAAYLEWAALLRQSDEYADAIAGYRTLQEDYPETISPEESSQLIIETLLEWGKALSERDEFAQSMKKFSEVEGLSEDPDLIQEAKDGYEEALLGLSRDEGPEGERIIQEATSTACDGEPAASPAVGFDEEAEGRALSCTSGLSISQDLRPEYPGHFRFVVSRKEGQETVQTCRYQAQHRLIRQRLFWTVTLRSAATGGIYTTKTFYGSPPPKCEQVETFYGQTKYKSGSEPSSSELSAWLESIIP